MAGDRSLAHEGSPASRPLQGYAPLSGFIGNLIESAAAYQRVLDEERARKEAIAANHSAAAYRMMQARGNCVTKPVVLAWLKANPGSARYQVAEGTGGTRTRTGKLLMELLEEGAVIRGGTRVLPTWSAK